MQVPRRIVTSLRPLAVLSTLAIALLVHAPLQAAAADSGYSITMTPSSTQLQAPPGGSTTNGFSVINEGAHGYSMSVSVAPYHVIGDNYQPQFTPLPGHTDASQWLHLEGPPSQYLAPRTPLNIDYSLTVPAGTVRL